MHKMPVSCYLSRLNNAISLSLSILLTCSNTFIIFVALSWICSTPTLSRFCFYQEAQGWTQHFLCDLSSAEERQRSQSQPPGNVTLFLMQPRRGCLPSLPQGHVAGSLSSWTTRAFSANLLLKQSAAVFLQVTAIPLNVSTTVWFINHSPPFSFVSSANLLKVHSVLWSRSSGKIMKHTVPRTCHGVHH